MRKTRWRRICRKNKLLPIVHLHLCKGLIILEKNEMGLNDFFFRKDFFHRFIFFVYFITRPINMTGNRRFVNLLKSKQKYKPILSPQVILKRHTHNRLMAAFSIYVSCEGNIWKLQKPFRRPWEFSSNM